MIKAIALDDEPLSLDVLSYFCEKHAGQIQLEKTFTQQKEAIKHLNKFPVDLLFLDIEMPVKNGISFYKDLESKPLLIFTTAYCEYAVEGFNVNAVDYLLKPFSEERFLQSLEKVRQNLGVRRSDESTPNFLSIRADYKLYKIDLKKIIYIEGLDDYLKIYVKDEPVIVARMSLKNIMEKLPAKDFLRIHKSFIVAVKNVNSVQSNSIGIQNIELPIGNTYKKEVLEFFN